LFVVAGTMGMDKQ